MRKVLVLLSLLLSLGVLAACGSKDTGGSVSPDGGQTEGIGKETEKEAYPKFLTIGTAGTGGAYYPIGIAMSQIIGDVLGINTNAQVTGGATENNTLIENKSVDLAITQSSLAYAAIQGTAPYETAAPSVRAIANGLSKGVFHVVTLRSTGIETIGDLKGKRVVLGPAGGAGISMALEVFAEYGIGANDFNPSYVTYSDGITALTDGTVDAVVVQSAAPASAIQELKATREKDMLLLSIEDDVRQSLLEKYPYYSEVVLAEDIYGTGGEIKTIFVSNMIVCSADLSEGLVYEITKAFFENVDKIKESHPAALGLSVEEAVKGSPIDFHPGAIKYFKEVGVMD
ncbi:TAXI family TRAP transporter solute-binding subunit [Anaerotalea alkaliphila]|uniref:TAXI family TRAP transporter solute-binding subunit n=1 Tax=Anaerotalea alkaliphila TaxID=2662126 RepID=A0A7X5KLF8_9FIRM|nr:TAXI family TRAP transporter solute-binding subunit [Anaerotalea alkaliphila]NDL66796.1 TAXI family TRAP transporter solute-binding subunit [Anaerotalea alkaliphila]